MGYSRCYFSLPTAAKSISLVLRQPGTGTGARDPHEEWDALFAPDRERESSEREDEDGESAAQAAAVPGVGDAAFWLGSPIGGTLYVRRGDRYFQLSVGGPDSPEQKKAKSIELAKFALARL